MKLKAMAGGLVFAALSLSAAVSQAAVCSVGDGGNVLWKGRWYPATVVKVNENQTRCYIHYTGYGNNWDEWVGPDRFQRTSGEMHEHHHHHGYRAGDAVQVRWKGQWYNASIVRVGDDKYKIHYDQYDSSWDEWVGPDRIRPR
jgi:hypothetical protein